MVIPKTEEPEAHKTAIELLKEKIQQSEFDFVVAHDRTEQFCIKMVASQNAEHTHAQAIEELTAAVNVLRGGA